MLAAAWSSAGTQSNPVFDHALRSLNQSLTSRTVLCRRQFGLQSAEIAENTGVAFVNDYSNEPAESGPGRRRKVEGMAKAATEIASPAIGDRVCRTADGLLESI